MNVTVGCVVLAACAGFAQDDPRATLDEARRIFEGIDEPGAEEADSLRDRVERVLREHARVLEHGDALYFRLRLAAAAGLPEEVVWSLEKHLADGTPPYQARSRVYATMTLCALDPARALAVWEDVDFAYLDPETRLLAHIVARDFVAKARRTAELVGRPAPVLRGIAEPRQEDVDVAALARSAQRPVIVVFWSWWCGGCKPLLKNLEALRASGALNAELVAPTRLYGEVALQGELLEGVSAHQECMIVRKLAREQAGGAPLVFVTDATEADWGVFGYPFVVVVDREGRWVASRSGPDLAWIEDQARRLGTE